MKNDEQRLPFDEAKAFSKRLNNTIRDWAAKTFGEQCAHIVLDQVRLLAWRASVNRQSPGKYMLTQKEAIAFMEAAEDIMEVVVSIRWKAIHGEEV